MQGIPVMENHDLSRPTNHYRTQLLPFRRSTSHVIKCGYEQNPSSLGQIIPLPASNIGPDPVNRMLVEVHDLPMGFDLFRT
jgi:hypothetical protein